MIGGQSRRGRLRFRQKQCRMKHIQGYLLPVSRCTLLGHGSAFLLLGFLTRPSGYHDSLLFAELLKHYQHSTTVARPALVRLPGPPKRLPQACWRNRAGGAGSGRDGLARSCFLPARPSSPRPPEGGFFGWALLMLPGFREKWHGGIVQRQWCRPSLRLRATDAQSRYPPSQKKSA